MLAWLLFKLKQSNCVEISRLLQLKKKTAPLRQLAWLMACDAIGGKGLAMISIQLTVYKVVAVTTITAHSLTSTRNGGAGDSVDGDEKMGQLLRLLCRSACWSVCLSVSIYRLVCLALFYLSLLSSCHSLILILILIRLHFVSQMATLVVQHRKE